MNYTIQNADLTQAIRSLYTATGMEITILALDAEELLTYPRHKGAFCSRVQTCARGAKRCRRSITDACGSTRMEAADSVATCHAGLTTAVTPIFDGTADIGYLWLGPCVKAETPAPEAWEQARCGCGPCPDFSAMEQAFYALPRVTGEQLSAYMYLMKAFAVFIAQQGTIKRNYRADFVRVQEYIDFNLAQDLSAAALCAALYVSRNTLFRIIRDETGLSLGQYVQKRRLAYANQLLRTTDHAILEIAGECGISDFNYFSRLFKKEYGLTPRDYRRGLYRKSG